MSQQPVRRPVGMTILLILSLVNACLQIFSALGMFLTVPTMSQMLENGELAEGMGPFLTLMRMSDEEIKAFWEIIETRLSISPTYYLLTALLYVGSLVGVLKMFKLQRIGFHIYSISQMLLLIVAVVYIYSTQGNSGFFSEFLTTAMFILLYHLYLKRIENDPTTKREQDIRPEA